MRWGIRSESSMAVDRPPEAQPARTSITGGGLNRAPTLGYLQRMFKRSLSLVLVSGALGALTGCASGSKYQGLPPKSHCKRRVKPRSFAKRSPRFGMVKAVGQIDTLVNKQLRFFIICINRKCMRAQILQFWFNLIA